MEFLSTIKEQLPDWAKDIRLNLDAVIARSTLPAEDAVGAALSAAYAARSPLLVEAFKSGLSETDANAALTASALMGMNNTWYPYVEMSGDAQLKSLPAQLRMNAYATHGGVEKNASSCSRWWPRSSAVPFLRAIALREPEERRPVDRAAARRRPHRRRGERRRAGADRSGQ